MNKNYLKAVEDNFPHDLPQKLMNSMIEAVQNYVLPIIYHDEIIDDGRLKSAIAEPEIKIIIEKWAKKNKLMKKYKLSYVNATENERKWYDYKIVTEDGHLFMPINIKASEMKSADNCSSIPSLFWTFTGVDPEYLVKTNITIKNVFNLIKQYCAGEGDYEINKASYIDYYYLIVNKIDIDSSFWTSLKRIRILTPNGSNLPFQCNWGQNYNTELKSYNEAKTYVLKIAKQSVEKRLQGLQETLKELKELIWEKDTSIWGVFICFIGLYEVK